MKKYIRTKDDIFEVIEDMTPRGNTTCVCNLKKGDLYLGFLFISNFSIIKQADTIEELCDEFVIADVEHKCWERVFKPSLELVLKDYEKPYEIYGAIWTDKGLIYVAKMNEKGELELL